jgi:hypothetical protein
MRTTEHEPRLSPKANGRRRGALKTLKTRSSNPREPAHSLLQALGLFPMTQIRVQYNSLQMRLIWKKYDSEFDPVVTVVGLAWLVGGVYGVALMGHALRHPLVWVLAAIPSLVAVMGVVTLLREYQLWKMR